MNKKTAQEYLSLYGTDLTAWPEDAKAILNGGEKTIQQWHELVAREKQFEQTLLCRSYELHSDDLPQRILAQCTGNNAKIAPAMQRLRCVDYLCSVFIRPAFSLAATLIVGLALGYSLPVFQPTHHDEHFDDYSTLFYFQDNLL